ncbi:MAG: molybdate ABC transporter permease subunit [Phenylobacterium sp.]|uniref:molybdate ABC transporter permease subunit n=1 Tax=Phenylobacterium sp. TaxID=1871053 RepID=UPI002725F38E|nr:molybdate ABC transporter permease subunit [Phenylobacterium sp.]MDO9433446.1 molybdate ABC transporter permease subunit [Phenylobacterium sp.]
MSALTQEDFAAVLLSLQVALVAILFGMPVALATAFAQTRSRFAVRVVLDTLVTLPLVLPPVATGYFLLLMFGRRGVVGAWLEKVGIVFAFDWTGAALAAGIMAFPLMVRPMRIAIEAIDREVDEAARTLGASGFTRFFRITLPLAAPGVAAGAILGFAKALGEFGATITFVAAIPGETLTLPAAIYAATQTPGGEARAMALCLVAAVIAVAAVLVSDAVGRWAGKAARGLR